MIEILQRHYGDDLDGAVFAILAASLLVTGAATLIRGFLFADKIKERRDFEMKRRHKVAAVTVGAGTGRVRSSIGSAAR